MGATSRDVFIKSLHLTWARSEQNTFYTWPVTIIHGLKYVYPYAVMLMTLSISSGHLVEKRQLNVFLWFIF